MSEGGVTAPARRRAPLDGWYRDTARSTRLVEDMLMPEAWVSPQPQSPAVWLADRSYRRRLGAKGPGAEAWLTAQGFQVPVGANSAGLDDHGILVARLATSEFLVEAVEGGEPRVAEARRQLASAARPPTVYPVERQDFVVEIGGRATNALLRQICNVDFEPLLASDAAAAGILLTSMVGVGVVAWVRTGGGEATVTLWCDPSFAQYFWTSLLDVGGDLDGGVALALPGSGGRRR